MRRPRLLMLAPAPRIRAGASAAPRVYRVARDLPASGFVRGDRLVATPDGRCTLLRDVTLEQLAHAVGTDAREDAAPC